MHRNTRRLTRLKFHPTYLSELEENGRPLMGCALMMETCIEQYNEERGYWLTVGPNTALVGVY